MKKPNNAPMTGRTKKTNTVAMSGRMKKPSTVKNENTGVAWKNNRRAQKTILPPLVKKGMWGPKSYVS